MSLTSPPRRSHSKYHPHAYVFVTEALKVAQDHLGRLADFDPDDEAAHISGRELLEGVRILGCKSFGMMAPSVFRSWNVNTTGDFGHIVFDLVERGELRKTDRDTLSDFENIYSFDDVFATSYAIDTSRAFRNL